MGEIMKSKTFWLLVVGSIIFISMFLFLEFNYVEKIDIYGDNIKNFFSFKSFDNIFLFITNIMSFSGIIIILGLSIYILRKKDAKKEMTLYIFSILFCLVITNIIKIVIKRERPLEQSIEVSGYSFPSSHSSISIVVYGFLILLIKKYYKGNFKRIYISICILLILLTGFSRIYFNVHYITDVIAGYSLGLVILCISNFILKKLT